MRGGLEGGRGVEGGEDGENTVTKIKRARPGRLGPDRSLHTAGDSLGESAGKKGGNHGGVVGACGLFAPTP